MESQRFRRKETKFKFIPALTGEDLEEEGSTHESDTSSMADEREIHFNLRKILDFINSQEESKFHDLEDFENVKIDEEFAK